MFTTSVVQMKDVGNGAFEIAHELSKPRISAVCKVKLLLVSASCCFQSLPDKQESADDDLEDEEEEQLFGSENEDANDE
jgi:hypothetical protein